MKSQILICILSMLIVLQASAQGRQNQRLENPPGLSSPRGYSQVAIINMGESSMLILSGQVALDSTGTVVGIGNMKAQTEQVFRNIEKIVSAYGGDMSNLVKLGYFTSDLSQLSVIREVRDQFIDINHPPASTLVEVKSLYRKEILIEIEAIAVVPNVVH